MISANDRPYEVHLARAGGREVELKAVMRQQPALDGKRLVGRRVVQDDMHSEAGGDRAVDEVEELLELDGTVMGAELVRDHAGGEIECCEEVDGAVAGVVVGAPRWRAGQQRQHRFGAVEGLDGLFSST